jgi:hypothetical protein
MAPFPFARKRRLNKTQGRMKKTLLAFLVVISHAALSQVYPLQVNAQLTPPYSPYLSDYKSPGSQNFTVLIRANDVTLTNYACRLRLTIEGVGITIRTKDSFHPQPLTLAGGGVPEIFYGGDIIEYFDANALDFSGYSRAEYDKTARLPEGIYRFTIEVLDYYRGTVVSNAGSATAWIVLNDPPLLNLPVNHSKIKIQEPPNILFSWTPRHTGSPNAAFTTEYTFKLVELWYSNQNPNDALLTQAPLYEITTGETRTSYGISEPTLIPGRSYAWQVTAHDTQGKDLFKNKGASEVFVFQYGEELAIPDNLLLRWAKPTTLAIRWDAVKNGEEEVKYRLAYRPRRRNAHDTHEWYETKTKFTEKTLYDLSPDTEYEVKVRTELIAQESEYTETEVFKTLKEETDKFICHDNVPPPPPPDDTKPVFPLSVNDTLHAGGYDVLVRDVMNVNGKYFGSGLAIVPWFNSAKVRVTFENISVNDRFWLTRGIIKSVWSADSKFLLDVEQPVEPGAAPKAGATDITVVSVDTLITVKGAAIATVTKDQDENIVITTTDGGKQVLRKGESYAIADETGNGYVIDKQGHIAKTTAKEAQAAAARADREYDLRFAFTRGKGQFGFDTKELDVLSPFYQRLDDGTFVPWKALATGRPDALGGRLNSGDIDSRKVRFQVGSSQVVPSTSSNGNFALTVNGKAGGMEEELLALYAAADTLPQKVLGKVNLATYNLMQYKLVIVPVNGAIMPGGLSPEAIADSLNRVYGQAVVEWTVAFESGISVPLGETFDEGQPGLFANYTGDMKKVISAYGNLLKNTFYLFLIDRPRDPSTLGYMPRNRQAGFVFIESHRGDAGEFAKTIAHELGHGAFNLRHIFAEYGLPIGATDNLMDYGGGTALCKYQWDAVHNPQTVFGLFDEEGENASVILTDLSGLKDFANEDGSYTFIAPSGIPFTLPATTQRVEFWSNDQYTDGSIVEGESPDGALISFTIGNEKYIYHKVQGGNTGTGYKREKEKGQPYVDVLSKTLKNTRQAIIGLPCLQNGELKFIAQKVSFQSHLPDDNSTAEGAVVAKLPIADPYDADFSSPKIFLEASLNFTYTEEAKQFIAENEACLNEMVRYVIKAADVIQRNPGYYTGYKKCSSYQMKYPHSGDTPSEKALHLGMYYEKLKAFPGELLAYIKQTNLARENILTTADPEALSSLLSNTCEYDFSEFTLEQRKHVLKTLSSGNMGDYWLGLGNDRENMVIYALEQAPQDQYNDLLEFLQNDHYGLLKTLINKCDNELIGNDNYDKLIDAITVMIQKSRPYNSLDDDIANDRILRWGDKNLYLNYEMRTNDWTNASSDKIVFSTTRYDHHYPGGGEVTGVRITSSETEYPEMEIDPFDFVPLRLYDDVSFAGDAILKRSVAELQAIPALYLYWIIHRKATTETIAHIRGQVNTALFVLGGWEISASSGGLRLAFTIADETFFATSFVLDAGIRRTLEAGAHGEDWSTVFKTFDALNLLYGSFRIGQGLTLAARAAIKQKGLIKQLKETEDWSRLTPADQNAVKAELARIEKGVDELEGVVNQDHISTLASSDQDEMWEALANKGDAGDLERVGNLKWLQIFEKELRAGFKDGWSWETVLAYGKRNYPAPETYLKAEYIQKHLRNFEDGVSFICPKEIVDNFGNPLGRQDGVYVAPYNVMKELIAETKGDMKLIERALGIQAGKWSSDEMVRIDVLNTEGLHLRMPSGNEVSANDNFIPGGYTNMGRKEAVIDPVPKNMYKQYNVYEYP